jgi:hypothetical protein
VEDKLIMHNYYEFTYADDLAMLAESEEELLEMIRKWKDGMEQKGLKVNKVIYQRFNLC